MSIFPACTPVHHMQCATEVRSYRSPEPRVADGCKPSSGH